MFQIFSMLQILTTSTLTLDKICSMKYPNSQHLSACNYLETSLTFHLKTLCPFYFKYTDRIILGRLTDFSLLRFVIFLFIHVHLLKKINKTFLWSPIHCS